MFYNNQRSRDKEAQLLKRFLNCLEDIEVYLDQYDEFFGLAFYKDDPMECVEKLRGFLSERHWKLIDEED